MRPTAIEGLTLRNVVYTQHVASTQDRAWSLIADLRNDPLWRREIVEVELLSGTPGSAPALYRERVEWEGLSGDTTLLVVEAKKNERVVVRTDDSGYQSLSEWTFDHSDGGCLITLSFSLQTMGALHVVEPFMWSIVTRWLERDLPTLEQHIGT